MERVVGQNDAHEEAREEGQESFEGVVTEIVYSPISIRPYLGAGPDGL